MREQTDVKPLSEEELDDFQEDVENGALRLGDFAQMKRMVLRLFATLDAERAKVAALTKELADAKKQLGIIHPVYDADDSYVGRHFTEDGQLEFKLVELPDLNKHTFNGKEYAIRFGVDDKNGDGWCSGPDDPDPLIWVGWELQGVRLLEVCVHESLHACLSGMSETEVDRIAKDVTAFTYRVLMRRDKNVREKSKRDALRNQCEAAEALVRELSSAVHAAAWEWPNIVSARAAHLAAKGATADAR